MAAYFEILGLILLHYIYPKGKVHFRVINIIFSLMFAFVVGFRTPGLGWDYYSYERIYNSIPSLIVSGSFYIPDTGVEILFQFLISVCKTFGFSYRLFLGFFSFLITYILGIAIIRIEPTYYIQAMSMYFCYYFLRYQFNTIRHGFLLSILLLSLSYLLENKKLIFFVLVLIGTGFHSLSIIFLIFFPLGMKRYNLNFIYFSLILSFLFYNFFSLSSILIKFFPSNYYISLYYSYIEAGNVSKSISIGTIVNLLLIFYCCSIAKTYNKNVFITVFVNCLIFSCIVNFVSWDVGVFTERICGIFNVALIFLIPNIMKAMNKKYKSVTVYSFIVVMFTMYLLYYLNQNVHVNNNGLYAYIPYSIYF